MLLSNYWLIKEYCDRVVPYDTAYGVNLGAKTIDGETNYDVYVSTGAGSGSSFDALCGPTRCLKNNLTARLGSGTTTETVGDYCLDTDITSSFTNVSVSKTTSVNGGSIVTVITITATNTTSADLTINEVGLGKDIYINSTKDTRYFLLLRTVLDDAVTVPSNQTATITISWTES